jgi:hypothetical protein
MHTMGYYAGEKSVGLGPIVLAICVVAMLGFGLLYFMCGHQASDADGLHSTSAAPQPAAQTE